MLAAKVDGELENAEKELLIRQLDLKFEINKLGLKSEQVALERAAIEQRRATADNDYQLINKIKGTVQGNIQSLGQIARALIRQAQSYVDLITKYTFYATRAFDLWTLQNRTSTFTFDSGYLDPDEVEHAFQAAARGDGSRILPLVGKYLPSWSKLPSLVALRGLYEDYSSDLNLTTETRFWSITDPGLLESLKKYGSVTLVTGLPKGRCEAKVLNVGIALVGATAGNDPSVTVIVEHTGEATILRQNGQTVTIQQPTRREPVSATFDPTMMGGLQEDEKPNFWGRSPAAVWRVAIDSESPVDLTNLQEIQFGIYYKCIFK